MFLTFSLTSIITVFGQNLIANTSLQFELHLTLMPGTIDQPSLINATQKY